MPHSQCLLYVHNKYESNILERKDIERHCGDVHYHGDVMKSSA